MKIAPVFALITVRTCTLKSIDVQFRPFLQIYKYATIIHMYVNMHDRRIRKDSRLHRHSQVGLFMQQRLIYGELCGVPAAAEG